MGDAAQVLRAAAELTRAEIDVMTHALGWPDSYNWRHARAWRGWAKNRLTPWRNWFCGDDPAWPGLGARGLAVSRWNMTACNGVRDEHQLWSVTPWGIAVLRARLDVERTEVNDV